MRQEICETCPVTSYKCSSVTKLEVLMWKETKSKITDDVYSRMSALLSDVVENSKERNVAFDKVWHLLFVLVATGMAGLLPVDLPVDFRFCIFVLFAVVALILVRTLKSKERTHAQLANTYSISGITTNLRRVK